MRTFLSLGPHKKILNPPSCTQNLHSVDSYQKQKDDILDSPCVPILELNHNTKDEILAGPKHDLLLQATTTHPLTIRALQNTKKAITLSVTSPISF